MVPVVVMLPQSELDSIERERNGTPRSTYLRTIIKNRNLK